MLSESFSFISFSLSLVSLFLKSKLYHVILQFERDVKEDIATHDDSLNYIIFLNIFSIVL